MFIYESMINLVKESPEGTIILVPSNLHTVMTRQLEISQIGVETIYGSLHSSQFYTMRVPLQYDSKTVTTVGAEVEAEASPEVNILDKVKVNTISTKIRGFFSKKKVVSTHPSLVDESYIRTVTNLIEDYYHQNPRVVKGRPILLSLSTIDPRTVRLLEKVNTRTPTPTYIMIPITVSDSRKYEIETIRKLREETTRLTLLLGIGTEKVTTKTKNNSITTKPILEYLQEPIIGDTLGIDQPENVKSASKTITTTILREIYKTTPPIPRNPVDYYAVNTILVDSIISEVKRTQRIHIEEHHGSTIYDVARYLYEKSNIITVRNKQYLSYTLKKIGVNWEIAEQVKKTVNTITPEQLTTYRYVRNTEINELLITN